MNRYFPRLATILVMIQCLSTHGALITFQVNMHAQTALGRFNPVSDMVIAAGTFDNWSTTMLALTPSPSAPDVFIGSFDDTADSRGGTLQYKFIINSGGTLNWESRNNRTATVSGAPQTLPVVYFNDVTTAATGGKITFSVNMKVQTELGRFDPANDTVICAGTFDNWSTSQFVLTNTPANTNVYSGIFNDLNESPGATVQYKFILNSASGGLTWEGINNRAFVLPSGNTNLAIVFFNNLTNQPGSGVPVTFQVNMGVMAAQGLFSPGTDTLTVGGTFNNWSPSASPLIQSTNNQNIYRGTFNDLNDAPGNPGQFKFIINSGTWESINNRAFTLSSTNQILPILFFNDVNDLGALTVTGSASAKISLGWMALPGAHLQSSTDLKQWQDVGNTAGAGLATVPMTEPKLFFRLTGP